MADFFDTFIASKGITVKDKLTEEEKIEIAEGVLTKQFAGKLVFSVAEKVALKAAVEGAIRRAEEELIGKGSTPADKPARTRKTVVIPGDDVLTALHNELKDASQTGRAPLKLYRSWVEESKLDVASPQFKSFFATKFKQTK